MDLPTSENPHLDPTVPLESRDAVMGLPEMGISSPNLSLAPGGVQAVTISNTSTGLLSFRATTNASWLHVSRYQGIALGSDQGSAPAELWIFADAGLSPGTYSGWVILESLFALNAPIVIDVTLTVPGCAGDGININDALNILRSAAGLTTCTADVSDANCDGQVNVADGLIVLRYLASLSTGVKAGCPPFG
jgi:hypothetical protein